MSPGRIAPIAITAYTATCATGRGLAALADAIADSRSGPDTQRLRHAAPGQLDRPRRRPGRHGMAGCIRGLGLPRDAAGGARPAR